MKIVIIGAGGHGKVLAECARDAGLDVAGFIDQGQIGRKVLGLPVLGGDDDLAAMKDHGVTGAIVAIGHNPVRAKLAQRIAEAGLDLVSVISPRAVISPTATIGAGTLVMPGAIINADARIGENVIVNTGAIVEHDCTLGDAVHVAPSSTLCGNVSVGARSFVGAGATVIPGRTIGVDVTVGAGACVVHDLPDSVCATGVPARPRG